MAGSYRTVFGEITSADRENEFAIYTPESTLDGLLQYLRIFYRVENLSGNGAPKVLRIKLAIGTERLTVVEKSLPPTSGVFIPADLLREISPLAAYPVANQVTLYFEMSQTLEGDDAVRFHMVSIEGGE